MTAPRHSEAGTALPRWPFIAMALPGVAVAAALIISGLGRARSGGRDSAGSRGTKILDAASTDRRMAPHTRLAEVRRLGRTRTREAAPFLQKFAAYDDPQLRLACPSFAPVDAGFLRAEAKRHAQELRTWHAARQRHGETGERQDPPLVLGMCRRGVRTALLHHIESVRGGEPFKPGAWELPFVAACWTATGQGLLPDTPCELAAMPELVSAPGLTDRYVCFAMGLAPAGLRAALAREFDRRFPPQRLARLGCLELVAAFVNYPLDVVSQARGQP